MDDVEAVDPVGTRCLVTGGAGFLGSNLADRLLREGRDVTVFDDFSRQGSRLNVTWLEERHAGDYLTTLEGDVRDAALVATAVSESDVVFHLAGQTAVTTSIAAPREDFEVNVLGTLNVLEAARAAETPPVVVYASTNKVYGDLETQPIVEEETRYTMPELPYGIPETMPLGFTSPYACSKGAGDQYVLAYARTYGVRAVVLRQSCVYGPRQMGVEDQGWAAWLVLAGALGLPAKIFGSGKQVRDLLYVDDLVDAYLAVVDSIGRTTGRAYNIGGGREFSVSVWHEFAALLSELGHLPPDVEFAPARQGDQRVYVSDTRRAADDFGWRPRVSPTEGIPKLVEWALASAGTLKPMLVPARG